MARSAARPLDVSSAEALAGSYRTQFFIRFALTQSALLMSFVVAMIRGELWPYLLGLPLFYIGIASIAPGRRGLARAQKGVHAQGSMLSLGRALDTTPLRPST